MMAGFREQADKILMILVKRPFTSDCEVNFDPSPLGPAPDDSDSSTFLDIESKEERPLLKI